MWKIRVAAMSAVVAVLVLAAACSQETSPNVATARSPGTVATSTPSLADLRDRALSYVKCMRDEGVNLDDPDPAGKIQLKPGDKTNPKYPDAYQKCKALLPDGGPAAANPFTAEQMEKLRQYAKCMRDNGVPDFADPGPQGFASAPNDQAAAAKAHVSCAPIIGANPSATAGQG